MLNIAGCTVDNDHLKNTLNKLIETLEELRLGRVRDTDHALTVRISEVERLGVFGRRKCLLRPGVTTRILDGNDLRGSLREIILSWNMGVDGSAITVILLVKNVEALDMESCNLGPGKVAKLIKNGKDSVKSLGRLIISGSALDLADMEGVAGLGLKVLEVGCCGLSEGVLARMISGSVVTLKCLEASFSKAIGEVDAEMISKMTWLRSLKLCECGLTEGLLSKMLEGKDIKESLEGLGISGNDLSLYSTEILSLRNH